MPKVSAAHKDAVRRRILDAALVCLARNDYRDITTRELVAEAGLSTGTIYNYFSSKELLYEALAEELLGEDVQRMQEEVGEGESTGGVLLRFLGTFFLSGTEPTIALSGFRGRVAMSGDARDAVERLNRFIVREFTPFVEKARADGYLREDIDAEALVELFDIIWDGVGRRAGTETFQTDADRIRSVLLTLVLSGVVTTKTRAELT